jgi:hypothetical protein
MSTELTTIRPPAHPAPRGDHPLRRVVTRTAATGGHVLHERLTRPQARAASDVPVSGRHITPEWLTAVMCRDVADAAVTAVRRPGGSSGTSERTALRLEYNAAGREAGLPVELYVKTTTHMTQRLVLGLSNVIDGEPYFYGRLRSRIAGIESPEGYHGAVDERTWRSIVLIEDVAATKGAVFTHPTKLVTRSNIEDLLSDMATWHGEMWEHAELAPMKAPAGHLHNISSFISMRKRSAVGARRAQSVIPRALHSRVDDLWHALGPSMDIAGSGSRTLLHGDSHVGNTYATREGRFGFTDWQVCLQGSWAYDFAYTVGSALRVEDRREWERELLEFYLERLERAGGEAPELAEAWEHYRRCAIYPYFAWVFTIGRSAMQPKMQPVDVCLPIIERTSNQINDLGALDAVGAKR